MLVSLRGRVIKAVHSGTHRKKKPKARLGLRELWVSSEQETLRGGRTEAAWGNGPELPK